MDDAIETTIDLLELFSPEVFCAVFLAVAWGVRFVSAFVESWREIRREENGDGY